MLEVSTLLSIKFQKEKDLEIAARIGQSLLELNRELKNRNDFLEESLNTSNDTIVQLRHELQLRTNLLHAYVENEDEIDAHSKESVDGLQWKVKKLESENESLRAEAMQLKKLSSGLEESERLHITECSKNLDLANEKINHLKALLVEKSSECAAQSAEVERLLKIVAAQTSRERTLTAENGDLKDQLDETVMIYEELSKDYAELQEKYTEVLSMLHDADEELKSIRRSMVRNRSGSIDSLYDSLASELETSDSGFCSGVTSARVVSDSIKAKEVPRQYTSLQLELDNASIENAEQNELCSSRSSFGKFSSGAISFSNDDKEATSSIFEDSYSSLLCCSSDMHPSTSETESFSYGTDKKTSNYGQESRNSSAKFCCRTSNVVLSGSNESLTCYEEPKLGEPGRPGTRDLDYSLRKRGIRKEIEQEYAKFRRQRGLLPVNAPFFLQPSPKKSAWSKTQGKHSYYMGLFARMDLLEKWKSCASRSLAEPLDASVGEKAVLSRAKIHTFDFPNSLMRNQSQPDVIGHYASQRQLDAVKAVETSHKPRSSICRLERFSSLRIRRSDSLSLVDQLSHNVFLEQLRSGIVMRMRRST